MLVATIIVVLQLPSAAPIRAMLVGEPLIQATVSLHDELILNRETTGQVEIWNCSSQPAKIIGFSRSCRHLVFRRDRQVSRDAALVR